MPEKMSALRMYIVLWAVPQFALPRTDGARRGEACAMTHFEVFFLTLSLLANVSRGPAPLFETSSLISVGLSRKIDLPQMTDGPQHSPG